MAKAQAEALGRALAKALAKASEVKAILANSECIRFLSPPLALLGGLNAILADLDFIGLLGLLGLLWPKFHEKGGTGESLWLLRNHLAMLFFVRGLGPRTGCVGHLGSNLAF